MDGGYGILVVDPPWPQKKGGLRKERPKQERKLDYETMSLRDISDLLATEIFPLGEDKHNVFLWVNEKFLIPAEKMMKKLGYKRHVRMVWDKGNGVAPAFTVRYTHEYMVWYYRPGNMLGVATDQRGKFGTVFRGQQREHSRKPDEAYEMLDTLFPDARKIDVFSREKRHGYDQWGNETDYFVEIEEEM